MQRYMNLKKYKYKENIRNIDTAEEAKAGLGVNEAIMHFYIPKPTLCLIQTCKPLFYTIIKRSRLDGKRNLLCKPESFTELKLLLDDNISTLSAL